MALLKLMYQRLAERQAGPLLNMQLPGLMLVPCAPVPPGPLAGPAGLLLVVQGSAGLLLVVQGPAVARKHLKLVHHVAGKKLPEIESPAGLLVLMQAGAETPGSLVAWLAALPVVGAAGPLVVWPAGLLELWPAGLLVAGPTGPLVEGPAALPVLMQ